MPGMYAAGEYDLAGFCVGVVEKDAIIDGSKTRPGDVVIGLASSGPHSNGYSLIRKLLATAKATPATKLDGGLVVRRAARADAHLRQAAARARQVGRRCAALRTSPAAGSPKTFRASFRKGSKCC